MSLVRVEHVSKDYLLGEQKVPALNDITLAIEPGDMCFPTYRQQGLLLARDDIADIMVNGATRTFIEVGGKIQLTNKKAPNSVSYCYG